MIRDDTDDLIAFLNSLVAIDPYAMAELLCIRVPCNQALADHPTVQVAVGGERSGYTFIAPGTSRVGVLGVLNGYCGVIDEGPLKNSGPIGAVYDKGRLLRFQRTGGLLGSNPVAAARPPAEDGAEVGS